MTTKRVRRTKEQMIADLEAKLAQLKSPSEADKPAKLTKESPGMPELLSAFDVAAKKNGLKAGELIFALSRFKRARLQISQLKYNTADAGE